MMMKVSNLQGSDGVSLQTQVCYWRTTKKEQKTCMLQRAEVRPHSQSKNSKSQEKEFAVNAQ